jgi:hypothetical protein
MLISRRRLVLYVLRSYGFSRALVSVMRNDTLDVTA